MTTAEQKINALFSELVPVSGKADTVAGEIVRAVSRIGYRNYNDGDHIGVGYGKETCNPAARYLLKNGGDEVAVIVRGMWGMEADSLYDKAVEMLEEAAAAYIEQHPELKATPNSEDMWSYRDEREYADYTAYYSKFIKQECDSYGYGFVRGIDAAFERQGEENREEWGLVLVMPKEVTEAAQHLGHEHFKSSAEDNISAGAYRQGYAEGREFDPTRRIAGGGVMNAVGS